MQVADKSRQGASRKASWALDGMVERARKVLSAWRHSMGNIIPGTIRKTDRDITSSWEYGGVWRIAGFPVSEAVKISKWNHYYSITLASTTINTLAAILLYLHGVN